MNADKKTVAIVGAGIVGVSTAIWLQREGHDVILIDKAGPAEGTSYGNGGVLASCAIVPVTAPGLLRKVPQMLLSPDQPLFLKWGYLPRLTPWLIKYLKHTKTAETLRIASALAPIIGDSLADHQALAHGTGAEKWIKPSDYMFVYKSREQFEADAFGWSVRRQHGFVWSEMEAAELHAYDPAFSPDLGFAARLGGHGWISDPGRYVKDLARHAEAKGARFFKAEVQDVIHEDGAVTGLRAGGDTIACDAVVIATGAWSKPLAKALGIDVPLESERGYHLELWEPSFMPRTPVMVASGKFVATPMEGRLRLAGVVEFGGLKAPASKAPMALLRKNLRATFPGMTWKEEKEWMGHRPATSDSIPLIGEVPAIKGAFLGFGHQHVGLTGGPKTGRLLAQLISGKKPNVDVTPYSPSRFTSKSI